MKKCVHAPFQAGGFQQPQSLTSCFLCSLLVASAANMLYYYSENYDFDEGKWQVPKPFFSCSQHAWLGSTRCAYSTAYWKRVEPANLFSSDS